VLSTFKELVSTVKSPVTVRFSKLGSTPLPKLIVSPLSPHVRVVPDCGIILSTSN
jgi:hypothetical protein